MKLFTIAVLLYASSIAESWALANLAGDGTELVMQEGRRRLVNDGKECWDHCNKKGGYCQWCGAGKACCREFWGTDPEECKRVSSDDVLWFLHTCVTPRRKKCDTAAKDADCCTFNNLCNAGEGDCDYDSDCAGSLVCRHDIGTHYGFPRDWDVCGKKCDAAANDAACCTTKSPCSVGEGDCDKDSECAGSLVCHHNVGASYGFKADWDVCAPAPTLENLEQTQGQQCAAYSSVDLGPSYSLEDCKSRVLGNTKCNAPNEIIMYSKAYSYAWGCRCCLKTYPGTHKYWDFYTVKHFTHGRRLEETSDPGDEHETALPPPPKRGRKLAE